MQQGRVGAIVIGAIVLGTYALRRRMKRGLRRTVRAFYVLHPADLKEIPFLKELTASLSDSISLSWGESLADAPDALVDVFIKRLPTGEELDRWPHASRVIVPFAGPTPQTQQLLRERPHLALHTAHFNATATSEMAVTLLLAVAKGLLPRDRAFRAVSAANAPMWTPGFMEPPTEAPTPTLSGKEALVLGYGACGTRVARALNALGMRVNACRRHAGARPTSDGVATVYSIDHLNHLLPSTAVLIVCLPGTKSTTGLLGAAQLAMLPKGAIVVNVGRGVVIDERALYDALVSGHLGGAGIDVCDPSNLSALCMRAPVSDLPPADR